MALLASVAEIAVLCTVTRPAVTRSPYLPTMVREPLDARAFAELVAQQALAVVGHDQLDVHAALEQRRQRADGVERAAGAGDRDGNR